MDSNNLNLFAKDRPTAIVIGAGFGGLAAGMRLGAKGYKVKLIEKNNAVGGRGASITKQGHRFDLGPTIITLPQMFRSLWQECGLDFDSDIDLKSLDPFYKIKFPDGTEFVAQPNQEAMRDEVKRLSPSDLKGYDRFMKDSETRFKIAFSDENTIGRLSMHRLWDTLKVLPLFGLLRADRSVYGHAAARVRDPRLRFALSFHPLFVGGDPFNVTSMWGLVSHIEKAYGVHCSIGGLAAIANAMAKIIERQGGEIILGQEVEEITCKQNRASGVKLVNNKIISSNIVVSNADAGHTYTRLLSKRAKKRWTNKKLEGRRWSMGLFVWHFGTKGTKKMWPDVGHHTILHGPRYKGHVRDIFIKGKLSDDMSLYVHRPTVTDKTAAPQGDDTFYVLSCVPNLGVKNPVDWKKEIEPYKEKMAKFLDEKLMPGFTDYITASYVMTPLDFRDDYLSPFGSGFSIEPRMFQSAWFRPHNVSEELEGLFLVGAGTHPGAGVPGVLASAEILGNMVPEISKFAKVANSKEEKLVGETASSL